MTTQTKPPDWWKPRPTPRRTCRRNRRAPTVIGGNKRALPPPTTFAALAEPKEPDGEPATITKQRGDDLRRSSPLCFVGIRKFVLARPKDRRRFCDYQYMNARLTRRQAEVLDLVAQGLTDRQIAERLTISPRTAGTHVADAMTVLDAATRAHAVYLHFVVHRQAERRASAPKKSSIRPIDI